MALSRKKIGEVLIEAGLITEFQLNTALNEQKRWGGKLADKLVRLGFLTEEMMLDALRDHMKTPTVNLRKVHITDEIIKMLPPEIIRKHHALPTGVKSIGGKDYLIVAMDDPSNLSMVDDLQFNCKLKIMPALAGPITLDRAIRYYLDKQGDLFSDTQLESHMSPQTVRERMEIAEGSRTVTGESISNAAEGKSAANVDSDKANDELAQLRLEFQILRDLLIEKDIIDRRQFSDKVLKLRSRRS